jgi:RNA polymerase-binding transcription factor DksA
MTATACAEALTSLERLQLRDKMQDLWRDEVRRLTLLSMELYDDPDAPEPAPSAVATTPWQLEAALADTRAALVQLEDAMRRLDKDGYGYCASCASPIDFTALLDEPITTSCRRCGG